MSAAAAPWPSRRGTARRTLALFCLLALAALLVLLAHGLSQIGPLPVQLLIDDQAVDSPLMLAGLAELAPAQRLLAAAALLLLGWLLLVTLPLLMLGGLALLLLLVGGVVLAVVGPPLLVVAAVLALLLSPLILLLLLLRWLLRGLLR